MIHDINGQRKLTFTDLNGKHWVVADDSNYGQQPEYSGIGSECIGEGKYLITYSVRDPSTGGNSYEYFYRVFDTKVSNFDGPPMYMGSGHNAPGIVNLEYQEDGRVVMYTDQYIYAEIRIDGVGNYIEFTELGTGSDKYYAVSRLIM